VRYNYECHGVSGSAFSRLRQQLDPPPLLVAGFLYGLTSPKTVVQG